MVDAARRGEGLPSNPGSGAGLSANAPNPTLRPTPSKAEPRYTVMRGAPMRTAKNMDVSLTVPTAVRLRPIQTVAAAVTAAKPATTGRPAKRNGSLMGIGS